VAACRAQYGLGTSAEGNNIVVVNVTIEKYERIVSYSFLA
jgi:hypothetical protein